MLHISIRQTADSIANDLNEGTLASESHRTQRSFWGHLTWQIEVFLPDPNAPEVAKPEDVSVTKLLSDDAHPNTDSSYVRLA